MHVPALRRCPLTWLCALSLILGSSPAIAESTPELTARVTDRAGVLEDGARRVLESKLEAYEKSTGHQFAVLVVPALNGEAIEDYSMRVVEQWKLGDKKRNDGLLLLVAVQDHRVRIEVGYGLEGAIPDALAGRVIRQFIAPKFRAGDYAGGIDAGLSALMSAAKGESLGPDPTANSGTKRRDDGRFFLLLIPLLFLSSLLGRAPRFVRAPINALIGAALGFFVFRALLSVIGGAALGFLLGLPRFRGGGFGGGGYFGGGFSGGSFGGGGGGGFSGGGGSFGGGGSSGSW